MKILQFCNEDTGTAWQRTQVFKRFNSENEVLFHSFLKKKQNIAQRIIRAFFHRLYIPLEQSNENKRLLNLVSTKTFDILFIEKCLTLKPKTLRSIKKMHPILRIICYTLDDCQGKGNISFYFIKCIPYYDLIATNKKHNIDFYKKHNTKKVFYFRNAFSTDVHKPIEVTNNNINKFGADVTFIGHYEKMRADYLYFLAEHGINVKIWGWGEDSKKTGILHKNIFNTNKHVYFDDFAKVINSSKICLNFLRKANHDTETTRTIEIPACKGFMLSENSVEQKELFEEDKEAVYFNDKNELLEKIYFYLKNDILRKKIAQSGYNRCIESNYSYDNQLRKIIEVLNHGNKKEL